MHGLTTHLDVRLLRAAIDEADRNADRLTENLAAFGGHSIGQRHGGHAPRLRDGNLAFGVPSQFVQVLYVFLYERVCVCGCLVFRANKNV